MSQQTEQKIIGLMEKAERTGAGGLRRDIYQQAIALLARDYADDMHEAGNTYNDAREVLTHTIAANTRG